MEELLIAVQRCGCVALPDEAATVLGMSPGSELLAELDPEAHTLTLRLVRHADGDQSSEPASCSYQL